MTDSNTTIQDLKKQIKQFIEEREWEQFHSPKNMSMHIATEAAELMELFLWFDNKHSWKELEKNRQAIEHEIADIAYGLFNFCQRTNIDLNTAIQNKMALNASKYPVEKAKGKTSRYDQL